SGGAGASTRRALVAVGRRMHAELARAGLEDEPAGDVRLLDVRPAEDVAEERARGGGVVRVAEQVDRLEGHGGILGERALRTIRTCASSLPLSSSLLCSRPQRSRSA